MSSNEVKAVVRRFFEDAWNKKNLSAVDELFAADFVSRSPLPGVAPDREGLKQWIAGAASAFPDIQFTIDDQVAEGHTVTTRWTSRGTHEGEFMGIPATGKAVTVTGISINRVIDGKIQDTWVEWSALGLMQQLGAVPA
jgi:steroid delta-isomerase-like uncharacterized protein